MITTRILRSDADLTSFARHYGARADVAVELPYLRRARVRAFFDGGAMVGGYVLNHNAPFRYLAALPGTDAELLGADRGDQFCEIICIWIDRGVGQVDRMWLYSHCFVDFLWSRKRYALGGSSHPGVVAVQRQALPHLVYEGPAEADGKRFHATVYYGSLSTGIVGFGRDLHRRLRRTLRTVTTLRGA